MRALPATSVPAHLHDSFLFCFAVFSLPNGECGEVVADEVCDSYILVSLCGSWCAERVNIMGQVPLLFKPVCGFCIWGLGELAVGILLALQLRSLGPTFAIAGPMPLLPHE